jgi:hypothetical protein
VTAERLRQLIILALAEHPAIDSCKPVETVWTDRLALAVEDRDGRLWRVHVLREPVEVVS